MTKPIDHALDACKNSGRAGKASPFYLFVYFLCNFNVNIILVYFETERGRDLIKRILAASAEQNNPIEEWKANLSKLLRSKRSTLGTRSVITKAKTIFKKGKQMVWQLFNQFGILMVNKGVTLGKRIERGCFLSFLLFYIEDKYWHKHKQNIHAMYGKQKQMVDA